MSDAAANTATPTVLDALATGACRTIDDLDATLSLKRWQITDVLRILVMRGYGEREPEGCFRLTDAGLAAHARGELIKPHVGRAGETKKLPQDTFRQRAWTVMRMSFSFTVPELVVAARRDERQPENNATVYIRYLKQAGYVIALPGRVKGTKKGSPGFKRYRLQKNTGPQAPVYFPSRKALRDFNIGEDVPCVSHP